MSQSGERMRERTGPAPTSTGSDHSLIYVNEESGTNRLHYVDNFGVDNIVSYLDTSEYIDAGPYRTLLTFTGVTGDFVDKFTSQGTSADGSSLYTFDITGLTGVGPMNMPNYFNISMCGGGGGGAGGDEGDIGQA